MTTDRAPIIKRKPVPDDWEKRLADLLKELPFLPASFKFTGAIHQGGLSSFEIVNKIK